MTANTTHQIVCCACGAINRTPVGKPLTSGKCGKCAGPLAMAGPVDVAPRAVEKLLTRDTGVFVIDAWAPWCGPCRSMAPGYAAVAKAYGGTVRFLKINVDEAQDVGRHLNVRGIPALFIGRDGAIVAERAGMMPESVLREWVSGVVGPPSAAAS